MAMGRREKDIKLLVEKFIKLVESLNPGERLSIKKVTTSTKVTTRKRAAGSKTPQKSAAKTKTAKAQARR